MEFVAGAKGAMLTSEDPQKKLAQEEGFCREQCQKEYKHSYVDVDGELCREDCREMEHHQYAYREAGGCYL